MGLETLGLMGASAGAKGLASLFQGADPAQLSAYVDQPGQYLDPADQMEQHLKDRYQLGGVLTGKAERPVTLPGAFAQPLPWYSGGGLPFSVGVTAQDPALYAPGLHQQRAGYQFAQPDYQALANKRWTGQEGYQVDPKGGGSAAPTSVGNWMFGEYAPRFDPNAGFMKNATDAQWGPQIFGALNQPQYGVDQPQVGGGIPQLKANLELIGVTSNPDGTFRADAPETPVGNPQLFSGTKGVVNPERPGKIGPLTGTYTSSGGGGGSEGGNEGGNEGVVPTPPYTNNRGTLRAGGPIVDTEDEDYVEQPPPPGPPPGMGSTTPWFSGQYTEDNPWNPRSHISHPNVTRRQPRNTRGGGGVSSGLSGPPTGMG
jgi:hypothetical protein